eukprot:753310-Hanusia_phi.AAC.1
MKADAHPNITRYFAKEEDGDFIYLALELCEASLASHVEEHSGANSSDISAEFCRRKEEEGTPPCLSPLLLLTLLVQLCSTTLHPLLPKEVSSRAPELEKRAWEARRDGWRWNELNSCLEICSMAYPFFTGASASSLLPSSLLVEVPHLLAAWGSSIETSNQATSCSLLLE